MSFASLTFVLFLPIVFIVYWYLLGGHRRAQNGFLLAASYVFYGWWDWRFLGLIAFSTAVTWLAALPKSQGKRRICSISAIIINLAILVLFKYFNFFGDNLRELMSWFGVAIDWVTIDILLPVGISFYTFQAISYSVDIMRGKIAPTRDPIAFAVFIAFFPQLVAGPIERSTELLPQFLHSRRWEWGSAVEGCRMILWGLLKKLCLADGCAVTADYVFGNLWPEMTMTSQFHNLTGILCFTLQIYGDFSGYSDIARGTARLFSIRLMSNFLYPYFSRNVIEFWHRWHRSLMQWFTEYVYIPLGGSRRGSVRKYINISVVFLLSGLWHGASWNFIVWGAWSAVIYLVAIALRCSKNHPDKTSVAARRNFHSMFLTFFVVMIGWIFFRAHSFEEACEVFQYTWFALVIFFVGGLVVSFIVAKANIRLRIWFLIVTGVFAIACIIRPELLAILISHDWILCSALVLGVEWIGRRYSFALEIMPSSKPLRYTIYIVLYFITLTGMTDSSPFIYFNF